jgi:hypothetical protein
MIQATFIHTYAPIVVAGQYAKCTASSVIIMEVLVVLMSLHVFKVA